MLVALFFSVLVAFVAADTLDDIPIDNAEFSGKGNQLTIKFPAKDGINLVIVHASDEPAFKALDEGKFKTPIMKTAANGVFSSTVTTPGISEISGKSLKYWVRVEVTKDGKSDGHNSGLRTATVAQGQ